MHLRIYLKKGHFADVTDFKKMIAFEDGKTTEQSEVFSYNFNNLSRYCTYQFQGNNTVVIKGKEILYLDFFNE